MTPEERFEAHEQWLLDHDKSLARMDALFAEIGEIQRQQSAVLLEIAQHVAWLLDRDDAHGERQ